MDPYSYTTYSTTEVDSGTAMAFLGVSIVVGLVLYAVFAFFLSKIFKKAGEDAWKAWVPIYNQWVFLELGGQKGWIALLSLAGVIPLIGWIGSIVAFVFSCIAAYRIGLNLQKESWFVVLYVLVAPVWIIWLAVDSSTWQGSKPVVANAGQESSPAPEAQAAPEAPEPPAEPQEPTPPQDVEEKPNNPPTPPLAS